jgi:TM2 domain-containing membrane protein YozV
MSDSVAAFVLGSVVWLVGGFGVAASLMSGWTLFAPFAGALIALGLGYCLLGVIWLVPRQAVVPAQLPMPYGASGTTGTTGTTQVAPKNPAMATLASFVFPGVGTMMNGEIGKGIFILAGYFVAWIFSFFLIGLPFLFGFWIWGMVDAYLGAKNWNAAYGIIS